MRRAVFVIFSSLVFVWAQDDTHLSPPQQVDRVFSKWDSTTSPGCAVSVIKDGNILYRRGYGMADLDHDVTITPHTVFHVASISKQFTAAAIILLANEGKLSLDDDVRKYIPELPDFGAAITIKHLIFHTSGLRDQWELLGLAGWRYSLDLITDDDVLAVISHQHELNFKPGDKHLYCNTGYTLLAQIVKRVSGQSMREFTSQHIFLPLGMQSTHFRDDHAEVVKNIAYGYVEAEGGKGYRLSVTNFDTVGATSLLTTVEDLARWDENFYHPVVGGPQLIKQQLERGTLNSGKPLDYAFGLQHGKYRGLPTVDHGGADAGYRADFLRFPGQHFSVACLCNKGEINPGELTRKVADIYLAGQFKQEAPVQAAAAKPVVLSADQLGQFTGLYWKADENRAVRVIRKQDKLFLASSEDDQLELQALPENRFRFVLFPITISFSAPASGGARQMAIQGENAEKPDVYELATEAKLTPGQLAAYAGTYISSEIEPTFQIDVETGALMLKRLKHKPEKLEPTIDDHFKGLNGDIHFQRSAEGVITGFMLNAGRIENFHFHKAR